MPQYLIIVQKIDTLHQLIKNIKSIFSMKPIETTMCITCVLCEMKKHMIIYTGIVMNDEIIK